jgi:hypothetical protein
MERAAPTRHARLHIPGGIGLLSWQGSGHPCPAGVGAKGTRARTRSWVVETLVYSLPQNALVWATQSETTNPSNIGPFIHELSKKVGTEMEKQGLLG